MEVDTVFTEKPYFKLTKEYPEGQLKIEDLTEVFVVAFRVKLPNYEEGPNEEENLKKSLNYYFFDSFEKAWKQYKYCGPRGGVLSRIFTDDEELINISKKSNDIVIPEELLEEYNKIEADASTQTIEALLEQSTEEKI